MIASTLREIWEPGGKEGIASKTAYETIGKRGAYLLARGRSLSLIVWQPEIGEGKLIKKTRTTHRQRLSPILERER